MNKKIKRFAFILLFILTFGLTGCGANTQTTKYCTDEDVSNIKTGLLEKIENGSTDSIYGVPSNDQLSKSGVIKALTTDGVAPDDTTTVTWDFLDSFDVVNEGVTTNKYKEAYVDYIYLTYHPKACLVMEDNHVDPISGGIITRKDFNYAFKNAGLFGMLAYPFSWMFVRGAEFLGGGTLNGVTIAISMFLVTFIVRGIILLLTLKSSKQQQKIQALQPQMNAINEKYAGKNDQYSKQAKAQEMMALYNKYNINPMSSLLTPFITLPIILAVYNAIRYTTVIFEQTLAGVSMGTKLGSAMLSKSWFAIVLFIVMAAAQFTTMKLPQWLAKSKMKSYQKEKLGKNARGNMMTYFMIAMVIFIALTLPTAMSIYWVASSAFSIAQTFLLNGNKKKGSE